MTGAVATLLVLVAGSVLVGQALMSAARIRAEPWLGPPLGLAALLVVAGVAVKLPGHATTALVALAGLLVLCAVYLARAKERVWASFALEAWPAAALAALAASIPFIAAGMVGVLGVGLVNDDMASHLLMAAWLQERFSPEPVLIGQGYPLGPHALVAALAKGLVTGPVEAFAGLTLAIPALTALMVFGVLGGLGRGVRTLVAAAVALPYLAAAYLAQEAFKEPIMALFLLAFALWLPRVGRARDAIPLGLLAAGSVYVYSFPGLAWLAGAAGALALVSLARSPRGRGAARAGIRRAWAPAAVACGVGLALVAPDLGRVVEFADFRALDPDRANEGGLGNLRGHISPLEALGVWPTSEFRLAAGAGSLPAVAFYAGAVLGALALAIGLPGWIRRYGWAAPAALAAAAVIYLGARGFGTVYTSAKALTVASPLVMLIALGGLLGGRKGAPDEAASARQAPHAAPSAGTQRREGRPSGPAQAPSAGTQRRKAYRSALAITFALAAAASSFLVLRQAPVGPTQHGLELSGIRPLIAGERALFLGRDNFVLYHLRGSRPFTHVRNFYDPYFVKPDFDLRQVGRKFDFDAVDAATLARFPFVITTRAAYASGPPPGYEAAFLTPSYALWRARGPVRGRRPAETGPRPTGPVRCDGAAPAGVAALASRATRRLEPGEWSPQATVESGSPATVALDLPAGRWHLSLEYDATRPLTLSAEGFEAEIPGNLDYRGTVPFWPAGTIEWPGGPLEITARVQEPPRLGRLLGARSVAHLGALALTRAGPGYMESVPPPYPGDGQRLGRARCGAEADWLGPHSP